MGVSLGMRPGGRHASWVRVTLVAVAGACMLAFALWAEPYALILARIARGRPTECGVLGALSSYGAAERFERWRAAFPGRAATIASDPAMGIVQVRTPDRAFWVREQGKEMDGPTLVNYLQAEHSWMEEENPSETVKPGDIVLDCGAHIGTFTSRALRHGAAKVISIEIDPVNLECLRRNFAGEIAEGRVVVYPKGAWDRETSMPFAVSSMNSGMGSLVLPTGEQTIPVQLTTVDRIVGELKLPRVSFIKMDIEGAERQALAGAKETLRRYRPALMLDFYHLPDDAQVLPRLIQETNAAYRPVCGPCENEKRGYKSHVMYFR